MENKMHDIRSMTETELRGLMAELDHPPYRAGQLFEWLHRRDAAFLDAPFAGMNNLPKKLRDALQASCYVSPCREVQRQTAADGTVKFLYELGDGVFIESVLMQYKHGNTLCISTQAGCCMGCQFCASAIGGLVRNLTAGEMCAQVYSVPGVSSVVLMGCGEPLDNYDATLRFIELITHPKGANIGARHITLSTCGLVPQIYALAELRLQITLAISLHAPSDALRKELMPIAKRYPLNELLKACRHYAETTRRRITFEYALANGINDTPAHAEQLAKILKGIHCHVNLIPLNPSVENAPFSPSLRRAAEAFAAVLNQIGIPATIRRSLGGDIAAACGQLRAAKQSSVKGNLDACNKTPKG